MKELSILLFLAVLNGLPGWTQTVFYSQGNLSVNLTTSWNTQPDGSGTNPENFHTSGQIFTVQNGHQMTASGNWTVSGTGSKVVISSGGQITSGSFNHWILSLNIEENGLYIMNHTSYSSLNFGTMHPGGKFQLNTNSYFKATLTYPTLVLNYPGIFNLPNVKANGGVVVKNGATWRGTANSTNTHEVAYITVENGGTMEGVSGTGSCTYNISGSLILQPGSNYNSNGSGENAPILNFSDDTGEITFAGTVLNSNHYINVTGTRELGADLPVASSQAITVSGNLSCGSYVLTGSGSFELSSNATLRTAHPDGLNGTLAVTGLKSLHATANYIFNGSTAQVTGSVMPNAVQDLTIDNAAGVNISSDEELTVSGTLKINSGKKLKIGPGKKVTAQTIVNEAGNEGLVIESNAVGTGSLNTTSENVRATVERYIQAWGVANEGWHLLSSPVVTEPVVGIWTPVGEGNDYDFYTWSESAAGLNWRNQKDGTNGIAGFIPGHGYLVAYQTTDTKVFRDTLNVADVLISGLTHTIGNPYAGWHLLGNPFPCAINWTEGFWGKSTSIGEFAQIWNSSNKSYTVLGSNGIIPSMNGFMVYTSEDDGYLTIPADAMVHHDDGWYKESPEQILIAVHDLDFGGLQETIIRFSEQGDTGFDPAEDCRFLPGYAPYLYTRAGDATLSLNTLPSLTPDTEIPLIFEKNHSSRFRIQLKECIQGARAILTDRITGTTIDLSNQSAYDFSSAASDDPERFLLHFAGVGTSELQTQHHWNIFPAKEEIVINRKDGANWKGNIIVCNMLGQAVVQLAADGQQTLHVPVKGENRYFVVMVVHHDQFITKKIFCR